jgi:hypothetical protein
MSGKLRTVEELYGANYLRYEILMLITLANGLASGIQG